MQVTNLEAETYSVGRCGAGSCGVKKCGVIDHETLCEVDHLGVVGKRGVIDHETLCEVHVLAD